MPALRKWTKQGILGELRKEKGLSWSSLRTHNPNLLSAAEKHFGSLRKAVGALGKDYEEISKRKPINKKWVIKGIHSFVATGDPLSCLYTSHSALMRKAKRVFGSVAKAFQAAGCRYDDLKRTPGHASRWAENEDVLKAIRRLPATYHEAIHRNHRGLKARAEKLFGSWRTAVETAGLRYRHAPPPIWPAKILLTKIRRLRDKSLASNMHTRLYHAARTAFGSWRYAVELAGFPYFEVAQRFRWTPAEVLYYVRWLAVRDMLIKRRSYPELYGYALKFFGSLETALGAARRDPASIHFKHKVKRAREIKSNPEIAKEIAV